VTVQRPTILLTGFGHFPGVARNATAELIPELSEAARRQFPQQRIVSEILPVEWARAPGALAELLRDLDAVVALHFGVAAQARGLQLEMIGRNRRSLLADACGSLPDAECVVEGGPETFPATLPAAVIIERLRGAGIACSTSDDAGGYLCNTLLYHSLATAAQRDRPFVAGFIHVPSTLARQSLADADPGALTWDQAIAGSLAIIDACLDAAKAPVVKLP
jgi:pyroglutamyl-peptidase